MCIILKLHYEKFDVSSLFCSKLVEEKLLGGRLDFALVKEGLTLFDMGGGHQNVLDHCAQTLRRRKLKLGNF